jgi:hypothetical protein
VLGPAEVFQADAFKLDAEVFATLHIATHIPHNLLFTFQLLHIWFALYHAS